MHDLDHRRARATDPARLAVLRCSREVERARTAGVVGRSLRMGGSYSAPAPVATSAAFADLCASLPQMSGKTVAVTGCTTGTGLVLARVCAERGARVLMLNRASTRAQTALQELSAIPGAGQVSFVECDLTSFASVRQAAATVKQELGDGGLDV